MTQLAVLLAVLIAAAIVVGNLTMTPAPPIEGCTVHPPLAWPLGVGC